ncbi:GNAT family N-acetyltransferase [Pseudorhodobacter ferrugineus]|uniref:GNAT family N-acetyltransferase n=1 Tax=Pseudorhodobacter ferrugineus TaxID=77008 RepID=UPI0003B4FD2C|nr:GNAT family N-acetyltransferase [Pseudorhodobacter ferrugineus]
MVLILRPASTADAAEATDILNAIIALGGTTAIETPLTKAEMVEWFLMPGPRVFFCTVAVQDGVMVGFQSVGRADYLPAACGEMGTYARIGQNQKGVGSALFAETIRAARGLGLTQLNAKIRCDNTGGLAYYSRMGFGDGQPAPDVTLKSGKVIARVHKRFGL